MLMRTFWLVSALFPGGTVLCAKVEVRGSLLRSLMDYKFTIQYTGWDNKRTVRESEQYLCAQAIFVRALCGRRILHVDARVLCARLLGAR